MNNIRAVQRALRVCPAVTRLTVYRRFAVVDRGLETEIAVSFCSELFNDTSTSWGVVSSDIARTSWELSAPGDS